MHLKEKKINLPKTIPSIPWEHGGVTLLWAPHSPCNLNCQYCYFGTLEGFQGFTSSFHGQLSHNNKNDATLEEIINFISTFTQNLVHRVFIAGGEPLYWNGMKPMVNALKNKGIQVIICTNGMPLNNNDVTSWLLGSNLEAISISLDSYDSQYNDYWRRDFSGHGWQSVVNGIKNVIQQRNELMIKTKIGIYSVITKLNVNHIHKTAKYVNDLGVDYFIIQPISLPRTHKLFNELSLDRNNYDALSEIIKLLSESKFSLRLSPHLYYELMLYSIVKDISFPKVKNCFGGKNLFFIEPDGSIWDCPSMYKIAGTPSTKFISIKETKAPELFSHKRLVKKTDCNYFSRDCVNMWQLMDFDNIID